MTAVIDVRDLHKRYGDRKVVDGLTLSVAEGEICGFLGANGSGKTTTIRMLCGLVRPDGGGGTCLGLDIIRDAPRIRLQIGYMTQRFSFYEDLTVTENLDFVAAVYEIASRREAVRAVIGRMGLGDRADQLAGQLSGGWKQRLALAACLIHQPQLLLLDEPTAGVDPKARRDFWEEIHRLAADGLTFLITTHYMDEASRCHRLGYIAYGNLLAHGTVAEVIRAGGLTTWEVSGENLSALADQLRSRPGVEQVVAFGQTLHVSGREAAKLNASVNPFQQDPWHWTQIEAGLEDVFISLMETSQDNFS